MKRFALLAALAFAVFPVGCAVQNDGSAAEETDDSSDELKSLVLTEKDDGSTVTVPEGQPLMVKLASNRTTGYDWRVASTDRTLGYPTITHTTSSTAVGSGGYTKLTWQTKGGISMIGTHSVKLEYQRPWAETAPPAKRFSFTVKIVPATPAAAHLGDADNGKTVTVRKGADVVVELTSNASTGYDWSVLSTDRSFGYPTITHKAASSTAIGAPGTTVLTWKTSGAFPGVGSHSVKLQYSRSWETKPPAKTFSFTVDITE